jgi:CheY-like chemotaxis protein
VVDIVQKRTGNTKNIIHVLFIDDEKNDAELVHLNLDNASLKVTTTSTPSEALELLAHQSFDCVVSDYKMPGMSGIELCREIRKTSNIPFIIYTGWESEKVAKAALAAGVDYYIRKQENLAHYQNLAKSIEHAVENRRDPSSI